MASEPFRPEYHFTAKEGWLNDPNGLYYLNGVYHLFYQYNPEGTQWGNMSWGHATSPDLIDWTEQEVALLYEEAEFFFSGGAVVDHANTSGFGYGENGEPPVVATYTSFIPATETETYDQYQSIAYSLDNGETWTQYEGNPVLDAESNEFRDPKVFWQEDESDPDGGYWVMGVVKALERVTEFHRSDDLKSWDLLSTFGPANAVGGVWEVPDLIEMTVENTGETKYLLIQNLNPGGIQGGSAAQIFIGDWDGTTFTADNIREAVPPGGTVLEDWESGAELPAGWTATGDFANGLGTSTGAQFGQQGVGGFEGGRLLNTFWEENPGSGPNGDAATGEITSDTFTISQDYINLLVGGGGHIGVPEETTVNLIVDGEVVRQATGSFGEWLEWSAWDVSEFQGQEARIRIVDANSGGWGHINVDQITFSDEAAIPSAELADWMDYGADHYATITWNNLPEGAKPTGIG